MAASVLLVVALAEVRVAQVARASIRYLAGQYWFWKAFQVAKSLSWATGYLMPDSRTARSTLSALALEGELRRVDADDGQAVVAVPRVPGLQVGLRCGCS